MFSTVLAAIGEPGQALWRARRLRRAARPAIDPGEDTLTGEEGVAPSYLKLGSNTQQPHGAS